MCAIVELQHPVQTTAYHAAHKHYNYLPLSCFTKATIFSLHGSFHIMHIPTHTYTHIYILYSPSLHLSTRHTLQIPPSSKKTIIDGVCHTQICALNQVPISTSMAGKEGQAKPVLSRESHTPRHDKGIALQVKPVLSRGENHTAKQSKGIALQTKPVLSGRESHTARQGKGIALHAKPVLGGESHTARQGKGIALHAKPVLGGHCSVLNNVSLIPHSLPAFVLFIGQTSDLFDRGMTDISDSTSHLPVRQPTTLDHQSDPVRHTPVIRTTWSSFVMCHGQNTTIPAFHLEYLSKQQIWDEDRYDRYTKRDYAYKKKSIQQFSGVTISRNENLRSTQ